ncbi:TonB-dependent receptor [Bryobacter aggregatus]|uniref:TonB-dependent receptor n=1 Tax=Bryobacter aggregatus TaxID=360054 RepID=UPI0004E26AC5|nr:carboxypeptidase regulatory-like domain-containing protein [Bryobacter aggregatus]
MRAISLLLYLLVLLQSTGSQLSAQGLTGKLSGTVLDGSGSVVSGAEVSVTNLQTSQSRIAKTDDEGYFVFNELLPGEYRLSVTAAGFKRYEQRSISLTATERVSLPKIALEVGAVNETISVTAEVVRLQTESSERSGLITTRQMQELPLKGRSYIGTAKLLPGVTDTANRESPGWNDLVGININGTRAGSINLTLDGVTSLDTGSMTGPYLAPNLDAVAEVKVLTSNYQAEYGRSSGGTINTVIKSGTKDFHGGAYYFFRNEAMNANEFFNNKNGLRRPNYKFNNPGYFIGGPVLIPGTKFNHNRDKLFFFWSQDFLPLTIPSGVQNQTFPTLAERGGDFSKSGVTVTDPFNSNTPFPGNIIPANRIDANGQKLLNLFPAPNTAGPGGQYNWAGLSVNKQPRRDSILRLDYNISPKTQAYIRLIQDYQASKGGFQLLAGLGGSNNWPQLPIAYEIRSAGLVSTLIHTFSTNKVNEFTFGVNRAKQSVEALTQAALDANSRTKVGLNIPQFFPQANPLGLIPNATFGGVPNAGSLNIEQRFPFFGTNNIWNWSDNLSWVSGKHSMKFGIFLERGTRNAARSTPFNGTFNFDRDATNPLDTGYAYSNALLGVVDGYTEANAHPGAHARYLNVEWFAQDTWRVTKRLTIDAGVRFYLIRPTISAGDKLGAFDIATYDRTLQPPLIQPFIDSTGTRVGRDPATGLTSPAVKIGSFSSAAGTPFQGVKIYNEGILYTPPIKVAPRIGLAWDVFGNGQTAIRTGFGIFYDRFSDDQILQLVQTPPLVLTSTANFTTINNLLATPLSKSPASVTSVQRDFKPPSVYNWSFGVQQRAWFGTVVDVAYVGNSQKNLLQTRNLNAVPYGTNFLPQNIDPTVTGNRPLNSNLLRPRPGFLDINYLEFAGIGNYNAFQAQLTKRFARKLTYNLSYTWSKAMDLVDGIGGTVSPVLNYRMRNYGRSGFDRTQNFQMNYTYNLPDFSKHWNNRATRIALDGWEVSGVTAFVTGAPSGVGYSLSYSADLTGGTGNGLDSRSVVVAKVDQPGPQGQWFNVNAIKPPTVGNSVNGTGNAAKVLFTQPGLANWDLSMFKNFKLGSSEQRRIQFRAEAYNAFNHTQFTGVDTGARFDQSGAQINSNLGYFNAAALARRLVLGLKFYF